MATVASIDTAVRANTQHFERGMNRAVKSLKQLQYEQRAAEKSAEGWQSAIERQIDVLKFGEDQVRLNELAMKGVDLQTRNNIRALIDHKKAIEDEADAIRAIRDETEEYYGTLGRNRGNTSPIAEDGLKSLKDIALLLKGGGAIAGFKILADQAELAGTSFEKWAIKVREGKESGQSFFEEIVLNIPVLGDLTKGASAAARGVGELVSAMQQWASQSSLPALGGGKKSDQISGGIFDIIAQVDKLQSESGFDRFAKQLWDVNAPLREIQDNLRNQSDLLKKENVVLWGQMSKQIDAANKMLEGLMENRASMVVAEENAAKQQAILAEAARKRQEEASKFQINFAEDSIKFMDEQAKAAEKVQSEINKELERGIQKSAQLQDEANEKQIRNFVSQQLNRKSFQTPLFAETATFGSRASFDARQRFLRGPEQSDKEIAKDILEEAKKQNLNLDRVIELLRDQFGEAGL